MILTAILLLAMREDIRSHRIPNMLILVGSLLGLLLNGFLPDGLGLLEALKGLALGMAVLLPIYLLRAMGAGDVKLMGVVGAFLGPEDLIGAVLATFIAGGLMALAVALWAKQLANLLLNIKLMLFGSLLEMGAGKLPVVDQAAVSVGKLPYAVAIAAGTFGYLIWQRVG